MKLLKFIADGDSAIVEAKDGKVHFILAAAANLGGGTLTIQADIGGTYEAVGVAMVAGVANEQVFDLGPRVKYRAVLSGSTTPVVTLVATGV